MRHYSLQWRAIFCHIEGFILKPILKIVLFFMLVDSMDIAHDKSFRGLWYNSQFGNKSIWTSVFDPSVF